MSRSGACLVPWLSNGKRNAVHFGLIIKCIELVRPTVSNIACLLVIWAIKQTQAKKKRKTKYKKRKKKPESTNSHLWECLYDTSGWSLRVGTLLKSRKGDVGTVFFTSLLFIYIYISIYTWSYSGGWASSLARAAKETKKNRGKRERKRARGNWSILKTPLSMCSTQYTFKRLHI